MNLLKTISGIQLTKQAFKQSAISSINNHLTIRNWLIGFYIIEFEQKGEDRAQYGKKILQVLAEKLADNSLSYSNLKVYRQFYYTYRHFNECIPIFLQKYFDLKGQSLISELEIFTNNEFAIRQSPIVQSKKENTKKIGLPPDSLLKKLSFTHFVQLLPIDDELKRAFYEIECIKGTWSVRELKRQIDSLYFERSGISEKPELLRNITQQNIEIYDSNELVKSPFTFEFLGLKSKDVVYESDLEQSLIENLQEFILELGNGFCFEARQKRIIIGDEYFYCDLVFYHRILKCHVLIELKTSSYSYEHYGQLKTYINYYKKEIVTKDDNPPVGILLVTNANQELVEYATADGDKDIFVSKYLLELPSKEQLINFIKNEKYN